MNRLVRFLSLVLCAVLMAACSQTPAPKPPAAEAPKPTPVPTPPPPSKNALIEALGGGKRPPAGPEDEEEEGVRKPRLSEIVVDPATGMRLMKIPKDPTLIVRDGRLYSTIVHVGAGVALVREDEDFYYVDAGPELTPDLMKKRRAEDKAAALPRIFEIPKEEAEVVAPPVSKKKIRLESQSVGLPKSGMWRENFALADLDGDGRPEIVSGPPRLSAQGIRIFKWNGERWHAVTPQMENAENLGIGYGGVAVADVDGDGRNDIVWGGHGGGMWVALNLGDMKFRVESRGLSRAISTRAVAAGDLDGDGRADVLAISDMAEGAKVGWKPRPAADGSIEGYDVRAFMNNGDRFAELVAGLDDRPCYGYSLALETRPADGKAPFFVSGCNYANGLNVLYEFDRAKMAFRNVSRPVVELYSVHTGSATGTFRKHPAAFVSYLKNRPANAVPDPTGDGVSIYYRDGDTWKRQRVVKRVGGDFGGSSGLAVGDLDGDGLDDVVWADDVTHRVRVFFQTPNGGFEELAPALEPTFPNSPTAVRIGDVDGDGRPDIVLMFQYLTGSETREGGFRFYRNLPGK